MRRCCRSLTPDILAEIRLQHCNFVAALANEIEHTHDGTNYHGHVDDNAENKVPAVSNESSYYERLHSHDGENYHIDNEEDSVQEPDSLLEQDTYDESVHRHDLGDEHRH